MTTAHQQIDHLKESVFLILDQQTDYLQLIPVAAVKLLQLTNDENSDIRDLTKVIETEPSLATEILKIVNSALFNLSKPVTSIQRAISFLGFAVIRNTALKVLFFNKLIKNRVGKRFDMLYFWQHCLFVATLSREIAKTLNHPDPDTIYTGGLIHDIGKMVLENHGLINFSTFISNYANETTSLLKSERDFFGVSHEQVGYVFCREWKIPDLITAIVAYHNIDKSSDRLYNKFKTEVAIVSFANYIAWLQGIGSFSNKKPIVLLPSAVLESIPFNSIDLELLLEQVDLEMRHTGQFYDIEFPSQAALRANLVKTSIFLSQPSTPQEPINSVHTTHEPLNFLSSLTIPHQSLDPDIFIPKTLKAIGESFNFDRVFMLNLTTKQRSLIAKYCWPQTTAAENFEIKVESLAGDLLNCLRSQQADIISARFNKNHNLLQQLEVDEFVAVPVMRNSRLTGVLYADNKHSKEAISSQILNIITPIANELGSALHNAKQYEQEKSKASLDALTGLLNKRTLFDCLEQIFSETSEQLDGVVVGFLDLDNFKTLNDNCGHQSGDLALQVVAEILQEITRSGDVVGRYGGEEFLFVLRDSSYSGAYRFAERIRQNIEAKGIQLRHRFKNQSLTVSIGIAVYHKKYHHYQEMIAAADKAMYQAKRSGRNKVIVVNQ